MRMLLAISRWIDSINTFVGRWIGWAILISILVSAVNAVMRKTFNMSSNAWLELQWYLFGAAYLLAAAYTLKQNEHIRIDIVYGLWSRRVQHWIDLLGHLLFLMPFAVLMFVYFVPHFMLSFTSGEMSSSPGGLIIWPAKLMLPLGFGLLVLQGVSEIIKKIAIMRGDMPDPALFVSAHQMAEQDGKTLAGEIKQ